MLRALTILGDHGEGDCIACILDELHDVAMLQRHDGQAVHRADPVPDLQHATAVRGTALDNPPQSCAGLLKGQRRTAYQWAHAVPSHPCENTSIITSYSILLDVFIQSYLHLSTKQSGSVDTST